MHGLSDDAISAARSLEEVLPEVFAAVDTMALQHRLEVGDHGEVRPGRLRLDDARRQFGLPRYSAHQALPMPSPPASCSSPRYAGVESCRGHFGRLNAA